MPPPFLHQFAVGFLLLAAGFLSTRAAGQSMVAESLDGPVTPAEIASFKAHINAVQPRTWTIVGNMANELAQYVTGQRLKAMAQTYQITGDTEILDRLIYFCDVILTQRNDILAAPLGQHVMWTGTVTHDWIQSQTDSDSTGNAPAGDGAGHLAHCAHLILQHPELLDRVVPDHDLHAHGATYAERAATFLAEADDVYASTILPHYLNLSNANRMYFSAGLPYSPGSDVPWNQQAMFSWGLMHAAAAHAILGYAPSLVSQYDGIVGDALDWFFYDSDSHTTFTTSAGTTAWQWGYKPTTHTSAIEDNSHGSLDIAWLYRCFQLGRYGLSASQFTPLANTLCDVMLLQPRWVAGKVNGMTTGSGNSGPTTYVRDGWLFLGEFRPDKYYDLVSTRVTPGNGTTDIGQFANFLWLKSRRHEAGYSVTFDPAPVPSTGARTVTLATPVSGASIRYTTNGTTPTAWSGTLYSGPISVGQTTEIKAVAYTGSWTSPVTTATYTIWAQPVAASPAAGTYASAQSVTLSSATAGATIRYTTDLTTPTPTSGAVYSGPIQVSSNVTLRAIAYTGALSPSNLQTLTYKIGAAAPTFSPSGGAYGSAQSVGMSCVTSGASIRYTTDGSTPTTSSTLYSGPVSVSTGTTLKALATVSGLSSSGVTTANYVIGTAAAPTFSLPPGTHMGMPWLTLDSGSAGATIYYSIDGSPPSAATGRIYSGPLQLTGNLTFKAIAVATNLQDSAVSTAAYIVSDDSGATPVSLAAGTVAASAHTASFVPANTVDGSFSTRWAGYGDGVWIQYDLGVVDMVSFVQLAWYLGSSRTYTFDVEVSVDGSNWTTVLAGQTSSGATTGLENYDFADTPGRYVRIVGHLSSVDNYTNLTEAWVWVADAGVTVPAGSVTASASTGSHMPANTVDGSFSTRWAGNGDGVWIQYDLGATRTIGSVYLAWYNGTSRTYTFDVQVSSNGSGWTTVLSGETSSGTTNDPETYDFADTPGRYVRIVGHLSSVDNYTNIIEAAIGIVPMELSVSAGAVTASAYSSSFVPANTVDGSLSTRWAGNGEGVWIRYDLGAVKTVGYVELAWYQGASRTYTFDLQGSTDGITWTTLVNRRTSTGATADLEIYEFPDTAVRHVRVIGHESNVDAYTNLTETHIWGY